MKPLVLYHANCADGFGAAFAAWLKLGDDAEYVACSYGKQADTFLETYLGRLTERDIYILDFSFSKPIMKYLISENKQVIWLDHHKSAFEMWCDEERTYTKHEDKYHTIILDNNKSGAYLAWEFFHPGTEVPMFIKHIDDYDRWQFKIEGTKAFNKALWSHAPWNFESWKNIAENEQVFGPEVLARMYTEGAAILRAHDQNVQSVVKGSARACRLIHVKDQDPSWYQTHEHWEAEFDVDAAGLAANCPPHLTSDVGHELANQSGTFGLCSTLSQTDLVAKCSLRSNAPYDVSAIAKSFGGGGHAQAAGFEVPITTLLGWLK